MLAEFKESLFNDGIRAPEEYWSKDQDLLKRQLKVELTSLAFGLEQADKVATKSDPQAQQAAGLIPRVTEILQGH